MPNKIDITGRRFGKLVAIKEMPSKNGKTYWLCQCDCGNEKVVQTCHLRKGMTKSCGCERTKTGNKVRAFRKRIKIALVEAFGNECQICKIKEIPEFYEFHHINQDEKEFGISSSGSTHSKNAYAKEAKKCAMLCPNCHRKIELGLIHPNLKSNFNEDIFFNMIEYLK